MSKVKIEVRNNGTALLCNGFLVYIAHDLSRNMTNEEADTSMPYIRRKLTTGRFDEPPAPITIIRPWTRDEAWEVIKERPFYTDAAGVRYELYALEPYESGYRICAMCGDIRYTFNPACIVNWVLDNGQPCGVAE